MVYLTHENYLLAIILQTLKLLVGMVEWSKQHGSTCKAKHCLLTMLATHDWSLTRKGKNLKIYILQ